jgi:anti-anti-sigma factor
MATELVKSSDAAGVRVIELALPDMLDAGQFDELNESVLAAIEGKAKVIIDLSGTRYVGSAILGLLVNTRQRLRQAEGQLVLCCLSKRLAEIFATSTLERLFRVAKTRPDALKAIA